MLCKQGAPVRIIPATRNATGSLMRQTHEDNVKEKISENDSGLLPDVKKDDIITTIERERPFAWRKYGHARGLSQQVFHATA